MVQLKDGRVLSGMIAGQDRNSITLRMPGSEDVDQQVSNSKKRAIENSICRSGLLGQPESGRAKRLDRLPHAQLTVGN